jgi:hypothetical protein
MVEPADHAPAAQPAQVIGHLAGGVGTPSRPARWRAGGGWGTRRWRWAGSRGRRSGHEARIPKAQGSGWLASWITGGATRSTSSVARAQPWRHLDGQQPLVGARAFGCGWSRLPSRRWQPRSLGWLPTVAPQRSALLQGLPAPGVLVEDVDGDSTPRVPSLVEKVPWCRCRHAGRRSADLVGRPSQRLSLPVAATNARARRGRGPRSWRETSTCPSDAPPRTRRPGRPG